MYNVYEYKNAIKIHLVCRHAAPHAVNPVDHVSVKKRANQKLYFVYIEGLVLHSTRRALFTRVLKTAH